MRYRNMSVEAIHAYITEHYRYDRTTGQFFHATRKHGTPRKIGAEAGTLDHSNHRYTIFIAGSNIARYRLIWLLEHGAWPDGYIHHLDGNKYNDAIANLVLARDFIAAGEVKHNRRSMPEPFVQMPTGVTFMERRGQYRVDIPGRPAQYFDSLSQAQGAL